MSSAGLFVPRIVRAQVVPYTFSDPQIYAKSKAAGGLSPPLTNLQAWYKADSLSLGNGAVVTTWPDSSGNGNNITQSNATYQPTFATGQLNGLPAIRFSTQYFNVPSFVSSFTAAEIYGIIKTDLYPPTNANNTGLWNWAGNDQRTHYSWTDGVIYDNFFSTTRITVGTPPATLAAWRCYNISTNGSTWIWRLDGTQFKTASSSLLANQASYVGTSFTGGTYYYLYGWIAEILLYNAVLSSGTRETISTYFNTKYGLSIA